ncbi:hypothetical protein N0V84_011308 [Fusarium piperis]|uniref:Uncharacterized protein n=1 Tax=Fusarium piperis TaxID=1435070 RepID=A0A9W8TCF4_9HYPO|nr:hypothetical protein N0V84_011308 [Fusarium piperis]
MATLNAVRSEQNGLVEKMTDVVGKVRGLDTAVGEVQANLKQVPTETRELVDVGSTHLMQELKSASRVLGTLPTKADLENWSTTKAEAQARSIEDAVSRSTNATLKRFLDSTMAEYSQKLASFEVREKVIKDLKESALELQKRCEGREKRLDIVCEKNKDLSLRLQTQKNDLAGKSARLDQLTSDLAEAEAEIAMRDTRISKAEALSRSKETAIREANELLDSYKAAIKAKDSEMKEMCTRLEAAEAQAALRVTRQPETQSSDTGILNRLSQVYLELSNEFRDIPTSNGSHGASDLPEIAVKIAPKLLEPQAKQMIQDFLSSGADGWYCLQQVVERGSRAESVPRGTCALHQEECVLVQAVVARGGAILNFYDPM